ncbi:DUF899 family protein [Chelatococcus sambhunathii]|uniref:DUF899 family protein n=1 Tax=Chelatococcus sambhunathii TaxID=363953 RepID=A0ABU1DDC1_9HYPH|nr:DUF899 family protein [Chelatococcus sambhunathii]MDR4306099.1 DUF899 family protein [Chelatococcus sambhunathii]
MSDGISYAAGKDRLAALRSRISDLRREIREVQGAIEPEQVADHEFIGADGPVRLSNLFAGRRDLFVVHNMGASCPNCTLWADGYNGVYRHLASRASFVVASPDPTDIQRRLAEARGWRFPMVSDPGSAFAAAMGYVDAAGRPRPGVSAFQLRDGAIFRVADVGSEPLDDFCIVWHLFEMLPGGADGWRAEPSEEAQASRAARG